MLRSIFKRKQQDPPDMAGPVTPEAVEAVFRGSSDFVLRKIDLGGFPGKTVTLCYIDGLISGADMAEMVIKPLTDKIRFPKELPMPATADIVASGGVYGFTAKRRNTLGDLVSDLLSGFCAVIFPFGAAVTFETRSRDRRSVNEPREEKVVKGSKDAFVETLRVNTTLVRRKLRDPRLKIKALTVGKRSNTPVAVIYIEGFTDPAIVAEAEKRLSAIDSAGVLNAAAIEESIADAPATPFPQLITTERPDKFALNLLEGRVGILADGLPVGFLAPGTFSQFLKVPEDLANHYIIASALTLLRYVALGLTLLLPAFYVAVAMYHHEMIPMKLMQSIITAKQSVPFPTAVEVIMMLLAFELLQEAGLRLPNPIGQTVSIIGAIIVGQSAVEAKVVSPVVVVVIALAGIAGYTMPNQDMSGALRIFRFLLVLMAVALGMFGLAIGFALLLYHLATLETFGVPYLTPFAGGRGGHILRALLRYPVKKRKDADPELTPEDE